MSIEDAKRFVALVDDMRKTQKDYFRTRDVNALNKARELERSVDRMLDEFEEEKYGGKLF